MKKFKTLAETDEEDLLVALAAIREAAKGILGTQRQQVEKAMAALGPEWTLVEVKRDKQQA